MLLVSIVKQRYYYIIQLFLFLDPQCQENKVDMCLIMDRSKFIRERNSPGFDNWQLILEFLSNLVRGMFENSSNSRVGVVAFAGDAELVFALNSYNSVNDIEQAILRIPYDGGDANIGEGLTQARTLCFNPANGDRSNARNVAILISPGLPSPPVLRDPALAAAEELKEEGVTLLTMGITDLIDQGFLTEAASESAEGLEQTSYPSLSFSVLSDVQRFIGGGCISGKYSYRRISE